MHESTDGDRVGERVRELRDERFLSRSELARKAGLSPSTIGDIERRANIEPHRRTVRKIADALDVSPRDICRWTPPSGR